MGLDVLWSGTWPVIQIQVWAMLIIAQMVAHLRFLVAQAAKVDLFDVSLRLLLREVSRFVEWGEDAIVVLAHLSRTGGIIRASRRMVRIVAPDDFVGTNDIESTRTVIPHDSS